MEGDWKGSTALFTGLWYMHGFAEGEVFRCVILPAVRVEILGHEEVAPPRITCVRGVHAEGVQTNCDEYILLIPLPFKEVLVTALAVIRRKSSHTDLPFVVVPREPFR
jgi:hypothetical protein